jgi:para-nitrobenzyl esterase
MMLADGSRCLFHKAIEESGTAGFGLPPRSLAQSEVVGETVAGLAGAPAGASSAQLRALPVSALLAAAETAQVAGLDDSSFIWLQAVVDGRVLKRPPPDVLEAGEQQRVPLIIGANARELNLHGDDVRAAVRRLYGPGAPEALRLYGLDGASMPPPDPRLGDVAAQVADDVTFRCPSGAVASAQARAGLPVWRYQYDVTPDQGAVTHGSEIASVMGDKPVSPPGADRRFSLQDYWVAFAETGDPNRAGLTPWPRFTNPAQAYLAFEDQGPQPKARLRAPFCRLLSNF